MIKLILEVLLGGTMERMLKHNNGLTAITAVLSAGSLYFGWANWQANAANARDIHNIKHALYYELKIDTDAADRPLDNRKREAKLPRDVAFQREETETRATQN